MTTIRRVRVWRETLGYGWSYEVRTADGWQMRECDYYMNRELAVHDARLSADRHDCPCVNDTAMIGREGKNLARPKAQRVHGAHKWQRHVMR